MTADDILDILRLTPHPEGGAFRETWRDPASTAIYHLLRSGERSHWHRVKGAAEIWHFYAGAPLRLYVADASGAWVEMLGTNLAAGERPQHVVPANAWQSATTTGEWTLVGCTVAPPFDFDRFEMAPPGWIPMGAR